MKWCLIILILNVICYELMVAFKSQEFVSNNILYLSPSIDYRKLQYVFGHELLRFEYNHKFITYDVQNLNNYTSLPYMAYKE